MSKKTMFFLIMLPYAIIAALVIAAENGPAPIPLDVLVLNTALILLSGFFCALVALLGWWTYSWWKSQSSYGLAETGFTLMMNNRKKARAIKNANQIAPALQTFLFTVLLRSLGVLEFQLGADAGCLSPNGRNVTFRKNCIYYVYELMSLSAPEQDLFVIKQLINQGIVSELQNYGIANLPWLFNASNGAIYPSVYLDRLTYDGVRHMLVFEVLFVGSDSAAAALTQVWERDKPQTVKPEAEVFDDEV